MGGELTRGQLAVRWGLGTACLAIEVAVLVLLTSACARHFSGSFFLWHPILMSVGVFIFLSNGVRVYTSLAGLTRWQARVTHGILSGSWVCLSIAGFAISLGYNLTNNRAHFSSVHSRLGLGVLFFSFLQGIAGTLKISVLYRTSQRFMRWHGRLGTLIYASALTAVLSGVYSQLDAAEQGSVVAVYVLTLILALAVLFFDFWVKGGDMVPKHGPPMPDHEHFVKNVNSSHPYYASLSLSPSQIYQSP